MEPVEDPDEPTEFVDRLLLRSRGRVGSTLRGKWHLDVLIGVGGMAAVYAATHRNGSRAAVKLLHSELLINREARERFLREGYVANAVAHEGAVKIIDDDTADDGSLFLVTELLDGETLEDRRVRSGGRLSEDEVLSVTDPLLDVLAAAHAKGVIHRDIKPENVFLTRAGQVKVLDFGIARLRELSTASSATKTGTTMGTPAFMAPEQARGLGDEIDGRTDLWALGATMFNLLTGQLVHNGRTANELLLSAMTNPAPPVSSAMPGISPAAAHVVDRALAFARERRWQSAGRMQEAVRRAYHDRHGKPITTAPKLIVPETVPNRTQASFPGNPSAGGVAGPNLPTTGQPVFHSGASPGTGSARTPLSNTVLAAIVIGAVATIGVAAGVVALVVSVTQRSVSTVVAPSALPPAVAVSASPTSIGIEPTASAPVIAATNLPLVAASLATGTGTPPTPPTPPTTASAAVPHPMPPATASAAPAQPINKLNCNPPYVIVAGKKKWKEECF